MGGLKKRTRFLRMELCGKVPLLSVYTFLVAARESRFLCVDAEVRHHISQHMAEWARADPRLTSVFGEEPASPVREPLSYPVCKR